MLYVTQLRQISRVSYQIAERMLCKRGSVEWSGTQRGSGEWWTGY